MDGLEKICRHHWKKRLKISKIAKFESDTSKNYSFAKKGNFTDVGIGGWVGKFVPPTIQTSVKFRDCEELYIH